MIVNRAWLWLVWISFINTSEKLGCGGKHNCKAGNCGGRLKSQSEKEHKKWYSNGTSSNTSYCAHSFEDNKNKHSSPFLWKLRKHRLMDTCVIHAYIKWVWCLTFGILSTFWCYVADSYAKKYYVIDYHLYFYILKLIKK